jgi:hypothetical protein
VVRAQKLEQAWSQVRDLAERHPGEWEGQDLGGEAPMRVFVGPRPPRRVLVVTKEAPVKRWDRSERPADVAVVVASGRLSRAQCSVLERIAATSAVPIGFIGDADPMSLHTFLALRVYLGVERVRYCGISDPVLDAIGDELVQPDRLRSLDMSTLDQEHLRVVATLIQPEQVFGPRVSAALRRGKKIQIEALSFRADLTSALFRVAVMMVTSRSRASALRRTRRPAR